jgi:hypothetical protein
MGKVCQASGWRYIFPVMTNRKKYGLPGNKGRWRKRIYWKIFSFEWLRLQMSFFTFPKLCTYVRIYLHIRWSHTIRNSCTTFSCMNTKVNVSPNTDVFQSYTANKSSLPVTMYCLHKVIPNLIIYKVHIVCFLMRPCTLAGLDLIAYMIPSGDDTTI